MLIKRSSRYNWMINTTAVTDSRGKMTMRNKRFANPRMRRFTCKSLQLASDCPCRNGCGEHALAPCANGIVVDCAFKVLRSCAVELEVKARDEPGDKYVHVGPCETVL